LYVAMRALALLLIFMLVAMPLLSPVTRGDKEVPIRLVKASCKSMPNGTTLVNIMLQLPNPGYKLERKNVTVSGSSVTVRLWFEAPRGPVIQVVSLWGITEQIESNIKKLIIIVNNKTLYSGECNTLQAQNSEPPNNENQLHPGTNTTNTQNPGEPRISENLKTNEIRTAGVATLLGIALAGALMALLARR